MATETFQTPSNLTNGATDYAPADVIKSSFQVKAGMAQMLKVILFNYSTSRAPQLTIK